jgi:ABC-type lipoprotein release transport system permease subunit
VFGEKQHKMIKEERPSSLDVTWTNKNKRYFESHFFESGVMMFLWIYISIYIYIHLSNA